MKKLKSYDANMKSKTPKKEFKPSGVGCTEKKCKGEMMYELPENKHPQLDLSRAICGECKWRGWV